MKVRAVFNRDGGAFQTMDMPAFALRTSSVFAEHGIRVVPEIVAGRDLMKALLAAASQPDTDLLLAAGGDGTVSAAAAVAWRKNIAFGVLPAGTMNLFARALGIPLDLETALSVLATGRIAKCDVATANGKPFLHQFSLGFHPRVVRMRGAYAYAGRIGKMVASLRAIAAVVTRPRRFRVAVTIDGKRQDARLSALSVSNNRMQPGLPPIAGTLTGGELAVYMVSEVRTVTLLRLVAGPFSGWLDRAAPILERTGTDVRLGFGQGRHVEATLDGELIESEAEVHIRIHPGGLSVLMPRMDEAAPGKATAPLGDHEAEQW